MKYGPWIVRMSDGEEVVRWMRGIGGKVEEMVAENAQKAEGLGYEGGKNWPRRELGE